jgi:hypothetical protein
MSCTCPEPHAVKVARENAARVGARLDTDSARALVRYCSRNGCNTSTALRDAIRRLSDTPDAELLDLTRLLGLPPDADPAAILDAVNALLSAGAPPDDGATAETADAAPPPTPRGLTKAEKAYCKANKLTTTEFRARLAGAAKRAPSARKAGG